jgi:inner membrane protein
MDPLTHGLLGASIAQARHGSKLGPRALVWGAVFAMAPDLDVVMTPTAPMAEWMWHRGFTHALWFAPVVGWLAGMGLARWQGGEARSWVELAVSCLLSHPLLDVCTTWGTQLLAPFSNARFAVDAIAILDPVYSLALAAGLLVGARAGVAAVRARRTAYGVLAFTTSYLALGLGINVAAEALARRQLLAQGVAVERVAAYPTLLQLPFRRVVARAGPTVRVGYMTLLRPRTIEWDVFEEARGPTVEAARTTWEASVFDWFAMGEATARVEADGAGARVEFDDLRFGLPGRPRDGLWGLRIRLDASGRPVAAERFERELPESVSRLLLTLWRETLGLG